MSKYQCKLIQEENMVLKKAIKTVIQENRQCNFPYILVPTHVGSAV